MVLFSLTLWCCCCWHCVVVVVVDIMLLLLTAAEAAVGGGQAEGGAGLAGAAESPQGHDLRQSGQSTLVVFSIISFLDS